MGKEIGVERCKKVQKERETTKKRDKGVVAKRKGRQRWTKWLMLNDVRKWGDMRKIKRERYRK